MYLHIYYLNWANLLILSCLCFSNLLELRIRNGIQFLGGYKLKQNKPVIDQLFFQMIIYLDYSLTINGRLFWTFAPKDCLVFNLLNDAENAVELAAF